MDRFTRKELKKDAFAREVGHTVAFLEKHRRRATLVGAAALALVVLAAGYHYYGKRQHALRQQELHAAMQIQDARVGARTGPFLTFPTQEEKNKAAMKAFSELAAKFPGSDEAIIARYYLGTNAADQGNLDEAARAFGEVAESGNEEYASLAKLALAHVYDAQGKTAEAEKLLRSLIEKPTIFVTKAQASIELARMLADTKPEEARKLLEPLRTEPGAVSRAALTALSELPK